MLKAIIIDLDGTLVDTAADLAGVVDNRGIKPDIGGTMKIVESMGLGCEDFLLVGDSTVDIETGAAGGIRLVGVSWGYRGRDELVKAGADIIIDRPTEILGLVA